MRRLHFAFLACNKNSRLFRDDPSYIYRCENLGLALQAAGHRVSLLHWTALSPRKYFDVAIFHRPRFSFVWRALLFLLRRTGVKLIADVDDLVFDPTLSTCSPGVLNGQISLAKTRRQYESHCRALRCFDMVTTSTQPLAEEVLRCLPGTSVKVLPNSVHLTWRTAPRPAKKHPGHVVTYFTGTRSHDRDFAVYSSGIERFLENDHTARLEVVGPLVFQLQSRPGQVIHHAKVAFSNYAELVGNSWVNLAPLEPTPFTRCKSALKIMEAGFYGIPTVCSPGPDAARFEGAGAIFALDGDACFNALMSLTKPAYYKTITEELPKRVTALADGSSVAETLLKFLGTK